MADLLSEADFSEYLVSIGWTREQANEGARMVSLGLSGDDNLAVWEEAHRAWIGWMSRRSW